MSDADAKSSQGDVPERPAANEAPLEPTGIYSPLDSTWQLGATHHPD